MKLENAENYTFSNRGNVIEGVDLVNSQFTHGLMLNKIKGEGEELNLETPIKASDVKKLFDLKIDTSIFNPTYVQDALALSIKDNDFIPFMKGIKDNDFTRLLKGVKTTMNSVKKELDVLKAKLVDNTIILPKEINSDNMAIKISIDKLQDMIKDFSAKKIPLVKFIEQIHDYKEKLEKTIEMSKKAIEIINDETLFEKTILDLPKKSEEYFIQKRKEIIETSKKLIDDASIIAKSLDEFSNAVEKSNDYDAMFVTNEEKSENEIQKDYELKQQFENLMI